MGEDVFGDGLLVRETLQQDDHLCLADGVHALSGHIPTLPIHVCRKYNRTIVHPSDGMRLTVFTLLPDASHNFDMLLIAAFTQQYFT